MMVSNVVDLCDGVWVDRVSSWYDEKGIGVREMEVDIMSMEDEMELVEKILSLLVYLCLGRRWGVLLYS